jgi:hypothetical protein
MDPLPVLRGGYEKAMVDSRFLGNANYTGTSGMISTLIGIAEERGLIFRGPHDPD